MTQTLHPDTAHKLNQRICAVCGRTELQSRSAVSAYTYFLRIILKERRSVLKFPNSDFAHPRCIERSRHE